MPEDSTREDAIRLYTFLKEFTQLRASKVTDLSSYEEVLWLSELPREPECSCAAWQRDTASPDTWVEIHKPRLSPPPKPPANIEPWLYTAQLEDTAREMPDLRDSISKEHQAGGGETDTQLLSDHPEVKLEWERYVEEQWWPWKAERRRVDPIQTAYTALFSLYQKQQTLGEQYEVVLGLGLMKRRWPSGVAVCRHLVVAHAQLTFDSQRGLVSIGPGAEGAKPQLEQDMLEPRDLPSPDELRCIEVDFESLGDQVWDARLVDSALTRWAHSASPDAVYSPDLAPPHSYSTEPHVCLAPAIILRRRSDRSFIRVFDEIVTQLRNGGSIPAGVHQFVATASTQPVGDVQVPPAMPPSDPEVYFPLPANEAQRRIVERLQASPGVLVQGPPGTGKSHTIVNLVSHLLATGKRVLVTSHTARALAVLQRYLRYRVPEIAPLAVVLLGEGRDALQAMEDSVQGITARQHTWDEAASRRHLEGLASQLDSERRRHAETLAELRAIRERETFEHPPRFGGYAGRLAQIGARLRDEAAECRWLQDRPEEHTDPPLSPAEFADLTRLLRDPCLARSTDDVACPLDPAAYLAPSAFAALARTERQALDACRQDGQLRATPTYAALEACPAEERESLVASLESLLGEIDQLDRHIHRWVAPAVRQILGDQDRAWRDILERTQGHLSAIGGRARWADELAVGGIGRRDHRTMRADADALLEHFEHGGGWGLFGPLRPAAAKRALYFRTEVTINGAPCDTTARLRDLLSWLAIEDRVAQLKAMWAPHYQVTSQSMATAVADFKDVSEPLAAALELHGRVVDLKARIAAIHGLGQPTWHDPATVEALCASGHAVDRAAAARRAQEQLQGRRPVATVAQGRSGLLVGALVQAFDSRNAAAYSTAFDELTARWRQFLARRVRDDLLSRLRRLAPKLAHDLLSSVSEPVWDGRAAQVTAAWRWAQALGWVERLADPRAEQQARLRMDDARDRIRHRMAELAAEKAWLHCFARMTEHQRQHLVAWSHQVRAIGRGTGRFAPLHRQHAREHMNECRGAIPAWIMPLYRVAETIRAGSELFDVAIIDEASQSGPEALLLAYIAKKLVVVGDDKQISPSYVGLDRDDVLHLRHRHLTDLPQADAYGVDQSFFDIAEIHYSGRIRLREHFRCMPEIIQFSNYLCYQAEPLIPLRQYGGDRLAPVVEAKFIPGGHLDGTGARLVNPPEAEAVVADLMHCLDDPRYKNKSFGVISLLGEHQAREIERRLLKSVGPEEMERRHIVCGDAYAFQGDERDVIFLSLVSAPSEARRIGTLTSEADKRRFNVAASRAREQMRLYHSCALSDLSSACLRHALLSYCLNPTVARSHVAGLELTKLRELAHVSDRAIALPPSPFESWFEVDVCLRIADRGYRVIPQYEILGYRIDLVVEGMANRMAVECDGDRWHGAERYDDDMGRQRDLERCGWRFWRVRGSSFALDPDRAMESLWDTLSSTGVEPQATPALPAPVLQVPGGAMPSPSLTGHPPPLRAVEPQPRDGSDRSCESETGSYLGDQFEFATDECNVSDDGGPGTFGGPEPDDEDLSGEGSGAEIGLLDSDYVEWKPVLLPEPRPGAVAQLVPGLVAIVDAEGPMPAHRACQLYVKAAGRQRVGKEIKKLLSAALRKALSDGRLESQREERDAGPAMQILRVKGRPAVVVRPRGPRRLQEVPASEIAAVMDRLQDKLNGLTGSDLYRAVLTFYDTRRMTTLIEARLRWIDTHRAELRRTPQLLEPQAPM